MNNLINALENADRICAQAAVHLDKAEFLTCELRSLNAANYKTVLKWAGLGFLIAEGAFLMISMLFAGAHGAESLIVLIAFACFALGIFCGVSGYKKDKAKKQQHYNETMHAIAAERTAAQDIFAANSDALSFLPNDYRHHRAIEYLINALSCGRVTTLADALDHYDNYHHRMQLERANAEIVAQQQAQTEHLGGIRRSNNVNAAANVANAVFNIVRRM